MDLRNFIYAEDEEDLSFLPKEPSFGFGTGSPFMSVNIEPLRADEEPILHPAEVTTYSRGSPKPELFVGHPGSVAARMKNRKYDVPFLTISDDDEVLLDVPELKDVENYDYRIL
uniref:Uncharacterized protein n=1 Tax=Tanacetum cinerariifolium TaxID=118510 RepID=A0A699HE56_TANCI|nr:hypothetical protein [Tanacetum cinerariifolium]